MCACEIPQWLPAQAKRTENARFEAGGGRNANGTRMSRRPDGKARKRMQAEGRNIHMDKTAGNVPGHQVNQRLGLLGRRSMMSCNASQHDIALLVGTQDDKSY